MPNYQLEEPTFLPINQMGQQILNSYNDFTITLTQQNTVLPLKELVSPFPLHCWSNSLTCIINLINN